MEKETISAKAKMLIAVAALGYFVDVYDLILFSVVRNPSLMSLGLKGEDLLNQGLNLMNVQMGGMLLGGILWGIYGDSVGFDVMDRKLLEAIIYKFDGGPVGVDNLASAISEERETIEDVIEPYLIQQGFLQRTPRGRVATAMAYTHLGLPSISSKE